MELSDHRGLRAGTLSGVVRSTLSAQHSDVVGHSDVMQLSKCLLEPGSELMNALYGGLPYVNLPSTL